MNAIEAVKVLKDHCEANICPDCCFATEINAGSPLAFLICGIRSPALWKIKEPDEIADAEDLQHVGYTDEQLGRNK